MKDHDDLRQLLKHQGITAEEFKTSLPNFRRLYFLKIAQLLAEDARPELLEPEHQLSQCLHKELARLSFGTPHTRTHARAHTPTCADGPDVCREHSCQPEACPRAAG